MKANADAPAFRWERARWHADRVADGCSPGAHIQALRLYGLWVPAVIDEGLRKACITHAAFGFYCTSVRMDIQTI